MARFAATLLALGVFLIDSVAAGDATTTVGGEMGSTEGPAGTTVAATTGSDAVSGAFRGRGFLAPFIAVIVLVLSSSGVVAETTTAGDSQATTVEPNDTTSPAATTAVDAVSGASRAGSFAPIFTLLMLLLLNSNVVAADGATTTANGNSGTTEGESTMAETTSSGDLVSAAPGVAKVSMSSLLLVAATLGLAGRR